MLFKGVGTALATPFSGGAIDYEALEKLIALQIEAKVPAIIISGTTGEAPTISSEEKAELFKRANEFIDGKAMFIAGTGTNDTSEVIKLSETAMKAGAQGLLINNPYYNKSSDEGVYASYEAVDKEVNIPIIVYNVPSRTGKNISAELGLELSKLKNVEGFKEASGDISQIVQFMAQKPDGIQVYSGNDDQVLAIMAHGGSGVISTISNIVPEMMVKITDAWFSGDTEAAKQAQFECHEIFKAIFIEVNPIPLKTAMGLMGLCSGEMRLPLVPLTGAKLEKLEAVLAKYGLLG
ncbi:MAG: 4-hydroxy-tetrahydrodipicolinate synthase [Eubacteriaceae bacterium]|nr:4-hydroxy-tetrahydrodipicolinate synthase [Eubacteriaceae bacterium]